MRVLGIEPARNVGEVARRRGIPTWTRPFRHDLLPELEHAMGRVDLIVGNGVLAHVAIINGFLFAASEVLAEGGHAVFDFPYVVDLLENNEYDTISHEQIYYLSVSALKRLATRAGLTLLDVSRPRPQRAEIRVVLVKGGDETSSATVQSMLESEAIQGLITPDTFVTLAGHVAKHKAEFIGLLRRLRSAHKTVGAYGAPSSGNTLLNACNMDNRFIEFTVDKNRQKEGLLLPGSLIPVFGLSRLLERQPDYTLILSWRRTAEIVKQEAEYLRRGGRFIVPLPSPRIVDRADAEAA